MVAHTQMCLSTHMKPLWQKQWTKLSSDQQLNVMVNLYMARTVWEWVGIQHRNLWNYESKSWAQWRKRIQSLHVYKSWCGVNPLMLCWEPISSFTSWPMLGKWESKLNWVLILFPRKLETSPWASLVFGIIKNLYPREKKNSIHH